MPRTIALGDHRLNRIGLGTNRLGDTPENRSFLEAAVAAGVNFIDTAHVYASGDSETVIGSALAPFPEDLVVATKGGYSGSSTEDLRSQLEQSFERLRTETISLYYLHRVNPDVPLEETMAVLKAPRRRPDHARRGVRGQRSANRARAVGGADRRRAERVQPVGAPRR